jgi:alkanesulfonate monooxygenase SsuD/methylene tetrahydromethanopterin reductase-like flavin-dependent oxidoreductase (luciferase family)
MVAATHTPRCDAAQAETVACRVERTGRPEAEVAPKHGVWIRNGAPHDPTETLELAVAAEAAGWDGVFVSDAVQESHTEPFTLLAAVAARTEKVTLGTWVTPLVARDVVHVARSAANVDQLSGGRLLLGFGLGNATEHDGLGIERKQLGSRYDAALAVLDGLLRGDSVTRHDEWFALDAVQLNVRPEQEPRPPILLGGTWPATSPVDRAARWDGYMPYWPGLAEGLDDSIEEGAREGELHELLAYYREQGGDGVVVLPKMSRYGSEYDELCEQLGADWLLTCDPLDVEAVRAGPPG